MTVKRTSTTQDKPLPTTQPLSPSKHKHTRNKSSDFENDPMITQNLGLPFLGIPFKGEVVVEDSDTDQESIVDDKVEALTAFDEKEVTALEPQNTITQETSPIQEPSVSVPTPRTLDAKASESVSSRNYHKTEPQTELGRDPSSSRNPNENIVTNPTATIMDETHSWCLSDVSSDIYSSSGDEKKRKSIASIPDIIVESSTSHQHQDTIHEEQPLIPASIIYGESDASISEPLAQDSTLGRKNEPQAEHLPPDGNALMINFGPDIVLEITGTAPRTVIPTTEKSDPPYERGISRTPSEQLSEGAQAKTDATDSADENKSSRVSIQLEAHSETLASPAKPVDQARNRSNSKSQEYAHSSPQSFVPSPIRRKSVASGRASIDAGRHPPSNLPAYSSPQKHTLDKMDKIPPPLPSPRRPPPPVPISRRGNIDQPSDVDSSVPVRPSASTSIIPTSPKSMGPPRRSMPPIPTTSHEQHDSLPFLSGPKVPDLHFESPISQSFTQDPLPFDSPMIAETSTLELSSPKRANSIATRTPTLETDPQSGVERMNTAEGSTAPSMLSSAMSSSNSRSSMSGSSETRITTFSTMLSEDSQQATATIGAEDKESQASTISKSLTSFLSEKGKGRITAKRLSRLPSMIRLPGKSNHDRDYAALSIASAAQEGNLAVLSKTLKEYPMLADVGVSSYKSTTREARTPLVWAAASGHVACLEVLAKYDPDCLAVDQQGKTALHHALEAGQVEGAEWLIYYFQSKARNRSITPNYLLDLADKTGSCPMHVAAGVGDVAALRVLQKNGATLNSVDNVGRTPLHIAVLRHRLDAVEYLVTQGYDKDACDDDGRTPLMLAASVNGQNNVKFLLENGVDRTKKDKSGDLAIHLACRMGHLSILEMLYLSPDDLEVTNARGERPLHIAAISNHVRVVRALLRANCQVNPWTKPPHTNIAKSKISTKPRTEGTPHPSTFLASTPLHYACSNGFYDVAAALMQHGAGVNLNQEDGTSPLMLACEAAHPGLVAALIQAFANVNAANSGECLTALHISCAKNDLESTRMLVENGANTRAKLTSKYEEMPAAYGRRLLGSMHSETVTYLANYNIKTMRAQFSAIRGSNVLLTSTTRDGMSGATPLADSSTSTLSPPSYTESQAQTSRERGPPQPWKPASYA